MKTDEAKELLNQRAKFLETYVPIIEGWSAKHLESIKFAIKVIEVFEMSLEDQGAFIVEYKDDKLKLNIGGKDYEI